MKIGIRQKVLMDVLTKGATAAISKDAQGDTSNLALLIKSVKMTADDKKFSIESTTDLMAIKHSVSVSEDEGVIVKEGGCILVPAKEIIDWVNIQGENSTINMTFSKLDTPEIINTLDDMDVSDSNDKFVIKKIGSLKLVSKDDQKTSSKWELDCYDPDQVKSVTFSSKAIKNFDIKGKQLETALSKVLIAALDSDYEHVLDSISIQTYKKDLYFAATDTKRCAVFKIPSEDVSNIDSKSPMLVQAALLDQISKIIDKDDVVSFTYDEDIEKVYILQKDLKIRLSSTEKDNVNKFPNIQGLLEKEYKLLTSLSRDALAKVLISSSLVNNDSALFSFSKEKETLTVKSISEDNKYKPNISNCGAPSTFKDANAVWGVSHLIDGLKIIKVEDIGIHIPDNLRSVKIMGKDDSSLMYFAMAIDNPKYLAENE